MQQAAGGVWWVDRPMENIAEIKIGKIGAE